MKVVKFGGSSLADAIQFRKVKDIVLSDPSRRLVIVSAPGKRFESDSKVTDMLYECWASHAAGADVYPVMYAIIQRYEDILRVGMPNSETDVRSIFDEIVAQIYAGQSRDYAASRGEYVCARLMAEYLGYEFVDASEIILFDENGHINNDMTDAAVRERLSGTSGVVIPGFYGAMPSGVIKTFKRGGSDITGSIIARAMQTELYENWTDVDGFLMASPKIVKDPMIIKSLTYREMRELSYMGASVLQEESIAPVREAGISINIRNTNNPSAAGTMIVDDGLASDEDSSIITGVAGNKNFKVITIEKEFMNEEIGLGRKVLQVLENYGIPFEHMPSGIDTLSVVVRGSELSGNVTRVVEDIKKAVNPDTISVEDGIALIAIVGRRMVRNVGTAARVFSAISRRGVNMRTIDQGSDELNIIIGVYNDDFEEAIRAIYEEFAKTE